MGRNGRPAYAHKFEQLRQVVAWSAQLQHFGHSRLIRDQLGSLKLRVWLLQHNLKSANLKIRLGPMGSWYFCASYAAALCLADLSSGCLPVFVHMAFIHFSALKMICFCQEIYSKDGCEAGSVVCCWFHSYPFQYLHRSAARTMIKIKDLPLCSSQCRCGVGCTKTIVFCSNFVPPWTKNTAIYHVCKCQIKKVSTRPLFTQVLGPPKKLQIAAFSSTSSFQSGEAKNTGFSSTATVVKKRRQFWLWANFCNFLAHINPKKIGISYGHSAGLKIWQGLKCSIITTQVLFSSNSKKWEETKTVPKLNCITHVFYLERRPLHYHTCCTYWFPRFLELTTLLTALNVGRVWIFVVVGCPAVK